MIQETVETILKKEINEDDYQLTEKGFEPKFITKKFKN